MRDYLKELEREERIKNLKNKLDLLITPFLTILVGISLYLCIYYLIYFSPYKQSALALMPTSLISSSSAKIAQTTSQESEIKSSSSSKIESSSSSETSKEMIESISSSEHFTKEPKHKETKKIATEEEKTIKIEEESEISKIDQEAISESRVDNNRSDSLFEDDKSNESILEESNNTKEENLQESSKIVCYRVDAEVLNVRSSPEIGDNIVSRVYMNDIICATRESDGWIESDIGWIYANRLVEVEN